MTEYIDLLSSSYNPEPLSTKFSSLISGGDPLLPERWQGTRNSLSLGRTKQAIEMSWVEGMGFAPQVHSVLTRQHMRLDAGRLLADIKHTHPEGMEPLEWRRILDTSFICGIKGWSNLRRNALGDGSWRPLIRKGVRFKMDSKGGVLYADL